jgi:uncharacterized protein YkwD
MNFDSIPNGTKLVFSFALLIVFSFAAFAQLPKKLNLQPFNYFSGNEFAGSNLRTRPRIFVDPVQPKTDVAVPKVEIPKLASKSISTAELERTAFDLLNQKRVENGLKPVVWNENIAKVARDYSESMAKNNFFSHQGLDGSMVDDRADAAGIKNWRSIGENIAYNRGYDNPVEFAVLRWMQSQTHRENLLSSKWNESGLGVAIAADGKTFYFTQVFLLKK